MRVVVLDNASDDGSADAVAAAFPQVELIRSPDNLGFARANNVIAETAATEWLLLLNSDTEVLPGAIDELLAFARANPAHGIYGGRTLFPDGSLNRGSCYDRLTPWSAFCHATGLVAAFRDSALFDTENIGGWARDSVREVDIVSGCFFLIRTALWRELGGFDPRFFMYGEEVDLCHRARARGWRPVVTPGGDDRAPRRRLAVEPGVEAHPGRPRAGQRRRAALAGPLAALGPGDALALGGEPLRGGDAAGARPASGAPPARAGSGPRSGPAATTGCAAGGRPDSRGRRSGSPGPAGQRMKSAAA